MNCQLHANVTNLENMKNGKITKIKKMQNLELIKPENHNLRRKPAIKIESEFSRKEKDSFIADTKPHVDQIKRKMEAKFKKPIFI